MSKRRFALPGIHDLSKEQDTVLALPDEGCHLIVGGPGTGKSVVALLRARRYSRNGVPYRFLVFNHILHQASRQLFDGDLASETWMGWFHALFREITGESLPRHASGDGNGFQPIDWNGAENIVAAMSCVPEFERPFLVIDEGQDMPPQFYGCLVNLGFENFFVVADQNQQITDQNSSRAEIANELGLGANDVIELTVNYRNAWPIARLARAFDTGDPATPPPALPERPAAGGAPTPQLYLCADGSLERIAKGILRLADRDPRQLIAVLAPSNAVRERYVNALGTVDIRLDNPRPEARTFHGQHRPELAFDQGGILVINAQACKGLEFDTVVLADIHEHYVRASDPDPTKRLFHVMVARARERVLLLMRCDAGRARLVDGILPTDRSVLERDAL